MVNPFHASNDKSSWTAGHGRKILQGVADILGRVGKNLGHGETVGVVTQSPD